VQGFTDRELTILVLVEQLEQITVPVNNLDAELDVAIPLPADGWHEAVERVGR
jgi:hypothetical protein